MDLKEADSLIAQLRQKPRATIFLALALAMVFALGAFFSSFLGEKGKQLASSTTEGASQRQSMKSNSAPISKEEVGFWIGRLCKTNTVTLSFEYESEGLSDEEYIRRLISSEGEAAVAADIPKHISLFHSNAIINEASLESKGCAEIVERDLRLFDSIRFLRIEDQLLGPIEINGSVASAKTAHLEEFMQIGQSRRPSRRVSRSLESTNRWTFVKTGSIWRIHSLIPGLFESTSKQRATTSRPGANEVARIEATRRTELWSGDWRHRSIDKHNRRVDGSMSLEIAPDLSVSGRYINQSTGGSEGRIVGTVSDSGNDITGTWENQYGERGRFAFKLGFGGRVFNGHYSLGEEVPGLKPGNFWNGTRSEGQSKAGSPETDRENWPKWATFCERDGGNWNWHSGECEGLPDDDF